MISADRVKNLRGKGKTAEEPNQPKSSVSGRKRNTLATVTQSCGVLSNITTFLKSRYLVDAVIFLLKNFLQRRKVC